MLRWPRRSSRLVRTSPFLLGGACDHGLGTDLVGGVVVGEELAKAAYGVAGADGDTTFAVGT